MMLNSAFAQGCLTRHNDILRTGRLRLNGTLLEWEPTSCVSMETSLGSLASAIGKSSKLPHGWIEHLDELVYCIMKSVSFHFVLMDVLRTLQDKFELDSVPTIPSDGIEYVVTLVEGCCESAVFWPKKSKIFTVDAETSEKVFYGAIQSLQTKFDFPPVRGEAQPYLVQMRVPKQRLAIFKSKENINVKLVTGMPLMRFEGGELIRSPATKRGNCSNGCGRAAARGFDTCCRTCVLSERASHGPVCEERTARHAEESTDFSPASGESLALSFSLFEAPAASRSRSQSHASSADFRSKDSKKSDFPRTRGLTGRSDLDSPRIEVSETDEDELLPLIFSIHAPGDP